MLAHDVLPGKRYLSPGQDVFAVGDGHVCWRAATPHERVAALAALYGTAEPGSAGGYIAALRHAMTRIGLPVGPARAPIAPLSAAGDDRVEAILREACLPLAEPPER